MKDRGEVVQKLKQVQFRHAKKAIEEGLSVSPANCAHNRRVAIPGMGWVGICDCQGSRFIGHVCDARESTTNRAPKCPVYSPARSEDDARAEIKRFFRESPVEEIAARYADVAALTWVLGDSPSTESPDPHLAVTVGEVTLWATSVEGAQVARAAFDALRADVEILRTEVQRMADEAKTRAETLAKATADAKSGENSVKDLKEELERVGAATEAARYQLGFARRQVDNVVTAFAVLGIAFPTHDPSVENVVEALRRIITVTTGLIPVPASSAPHSGGLGRAIRSFFGRGKL